MCNLCGKALQAVVPSFVNSKAQVSMPAQDKNDNSYTLVSAEPMRLGHMPIVWTKQSVQSVVATSQIVVLPHVPYNDFVLQATTASVFDFGSSKAVVKLPTTPEKLYSQVTAAPAPVRPRARW